MVSANSALSSAAINTSHLLLIVAKFRVFRLPTSGKTKDAGNKIVQNGVHSACVIDRACQKPGPDFFTHLISHKQNRRRTHRLVQ